MTYYVYKLIDPILNRIFYIGKGKGNRAWTHNTFKDGNENPHKDRYIKNLHRQGLEPIIEIVRYFSNESDAYDFEENLIESIGLENLTNITSNARPPSKKGWKPSEETLNKRSKRLKGIPRTPEWCHKLSLSKQGKNNPMYGKNLPCSEKRRISIIREKNRKNYDLYKNAILAIESGKPVSVVSKELNIGRGICFLLKNRTHGIFEAFPELKEFKTG